MCTVGEAWHNFYELSAIGACIEPALFFSISTLILITQCQTAPDIASWAGACNCCRSSREFALARASGRYATLPLTTLCCLRIVCCFANVKLYCDVVETSHDTEHSCATGRNGAYAPALTLEVLSNSKGNGFYRSPLILYQNLIIALSIIVFGRKQSSLHF